MPGRSRNTHGAGFPFWSPDSRTIGSFSARSLRTIDIDGGPVQSLTPAQNRELRGGTWSPDGRTIVFGSISGGLFSVPAGGGQPVPLTQIGANGRESSHRFPSFLPDGKHLLA
jgi:Tol biopolymer transport system component